MLKIKEYVGFDIKNTKNITTDKSCNNVNKKDKATNNKKINNKKA